jgi:hypothetical protein
MKKISLSRNIFGAICLLYLFCSNILPAFANNNVTDNSSYSSLSNDERICVALDLLKGTTGDYSRRVILGNNPTHKPIKIEFKNLAAISSAYGGANALGMKRNGRIYIYINEKNSNAPVIALAALLAHEALHNDNYNSREEEACAWTTEAIVWGELVAQYPQYKDNLSPLACREKTLKLLYDKGEGTGRYIKKIVYALPNYENLPETSPGF